MTLTEMVTDVQAHLVEGARLLEQHIPALLARAQQAEADPLVQAVEAAVLPAPVRLLAAEFISKLAAEFPVPAAEPDGAEADPAAAPA